MVQRCKACSGWQWGPEWICHRCRSFDMGREKVEGRGRIFSWERVWNPVHPALKGHGPSNVDLVEWPHCDTNRQDGNLFGNPKEADRRGSAVTTEQRHMEKNRVRS